MVWVRLLGLAFLTAWSLGMGQTPPAGLTPLGKMIASLVFVTAPMLYMLPTLEAWLREHRHTGAIAALNLLLGWSVVGWVAALVWSLVQGPPSPAAAPVPPAPAPPPWPPAAHRKPAAATTKRCPYCAETILIEAVKCKHCGSELSGRKP